jgi:hypothetical protein
MFDKSREALFDTSLGRRLDPFGTDETPLVDVLYSITRPTTDPKPEPMTRAMKRAAAKKLTETPLPAPPQPKGMQRPVKHTPLPPLLRRRGSSA